MLKGFQRKAFTLIELLVVMAIIGILVSLVLPAVQQMRETARRTECLNNIRQLSLAVQMLEGAQRRLPNGWTERFVGDPEPDYDNRFGWSTYLLPFIEAENLYKTYDPRSTYFVDGTDDIASNIPMYTCPSDTLAELNPNWSDRGAFAKMNYAGNSGIAVMYDVSIEYDDGSPPDTAATGSGELTDGGIFGMNSRTRYRDMSRDGTSNTVLFGERGGYDSNADDPTIPVPREAEPNVLVRIGLPGFDDSDSDPLQIGAHGAAQVSQGLHFYDPSAANPIVNGDYRINANTDEDGDGINAFTIGYSSSHPLGANFAFADGSSRFIPDSVDDSVLMNLLQRNDGNVLDRTEFE